MIAHSPEFKKRRFQNWFLLGLLYAFFYMTRYNFAAVMNELAKTFGWTNTQLGVFETVMPLIYGLSVVLNGPIADRIGGKKAFLFGAAGVSVMNFVFGLCLLTVQTPAVMTGAGHAAKLISPAVLRFGLEPSHLLAIMATVWGINGYFQSFGALSIVKVNAQWFHLKERGTFAGIFGVLIRMGLILAFSVIPLLMLVFPLPFAFWIPGVCVALLFVANFFWMENSPKDADLGEFDTGGDPEENDGKPPTLSYVLNKVFANPTTWTIAISSMMIGMVRRSTIDSWYPKYFKEIHGAAGAIPYQAAVWGIATLGIAGGFAFGIASDRVYAGRRAPVIGFGFAGMAFVLCLFGLLDRASCGPWAAAICLSVLSFFVNGAHGMIGGAASMDFGGKKAAATAAGLFDGMQYLASSVVGVGMGFTLDHWGWKAWQWMPVPFAIVGLLLTTRIWNAIPGKRSH